MKIGIFDMDEPKNVFWGSGQAVVTKEIFSRLSKSNQITVYCTKFPGFTDYEENGISYKHIGIVNKSHELTNLVYLLSLPFVARKFKGDIVIENFTAPISTCLTPLFTKVPVIGVTSFFSADKLGAKYKINFSIFEKIGIKYYKNVIALNNVDNDKLKKLNPHLNTKLIFNGVSDKYFKIKTRENSYILFLGRIDINQKGLDILIEAFKNASTKIKDNLVVAGGGDPGDVAKLQSLVLDNKLSSRVKIVGKIHGKEKEEFLANAKYLVFPSRYEGLSISSLEACACGKAFVCFDIPGFSWLTNGKETLKAKPFSSDEFSNYLTKLSTSKKLRRDIGKRVKVKAKDFSWDKSAQSYDEFFHQVLV